MEQSRDLFVEGVEVREATDGEPLMMGGYAAVFNQETIINGPDGVRWREKIAPSAFTEAIGRDDVIAAVNHDNKMVLGRTKAGTLALTADAHGLRYNVKLGNTTLARDTVESVRRGDYTGSSFRFTVPAGGVRMEQRPSHPGDMPLLVVERVKLIDVGPVTFPAYEGTSVSLRSVPDVLSDFLKADEATKVAAAAAAEVAERAKPVDVKDREAMRASLDTAKAWRR